MPSAPKLGSSAADVEQRSAYARAREWVLGLKPGSWFWLRDVPAPPQLASAVMRSLVAERPEIEQLAEGFFWKGEPGKLRTPWRSRKMTALIYAGPGCGLADYYALNTVGWTTQMPAKIRVCVVGKAPEPVDVCAEYFLRSNRRRLELTWAEVSMIEAVSDFWISEVSWDEALRKVDRDVHISRLGHDAVIRSEVLRWGAAGEKEQPAVFHDRMEKLCDRLPAERRRADYMAERRSLWPPGTSRRAVLLD